MPVYKNSPSSYPGLTSLYPCGIFASVLPRHWCAVGYQRVLKSLWCRVPSVPDGTHYVDLVIWNPQVLTYASWLERRIHMHPNMPGVDESDMTVASLLEMWYDATMPSEHSLVNQVHSFTRLQKLIWCRAHLYNRYRIAQLRCLFVLSNYALLPVRDQLHDLDFASESGISMTQGLMVPRGVPSGYRPPVPYAERDQECRAIERRVCARWCRDDAMP